MHAGAFGATMTRGRHVSVEAATSEARSIENVDAGLGHTAARPATLGKTSYVI